MFNRVIAFGDDNAADFAAGSKALTCFAGLKAIIVKLDAAKAGQRTATGGTAREILFDALRLDLQNIARTARAIALQEPGFADGFRLPDVPTDGALLTTADAYLTRLAEQLADDAATKTRKAAMVAKFVAHELPADFVTDLRDDIKAIRDALAAQENERANGVGSTAAIGPLLKEGNALVATLDAIMHNKYTRQPDKLRAWQSASHVERAPQREKSPAPLPPTPPPAPANP